jgi:hypothetical protein
MATDQKLISSLLDLSRNVDKLSGDIKKNTTTTSDLVETQTKAADNTKDFGKIAEGIKGLDLGSLKGEFSQLTKGIEGLDFQGLSKDLKSLDFKGLTQGIKGLDFKDLTQGIKGLDFKGLTQGIKGLDFKDLTKGIKGLDFKDLTKGIKGLDFKSLGQDLKKLDFKDLAGSIKGLDLKGISGAAKGLDIGGIANAVKGGGIKNVVSGSLGGLAKGFGKKLLGGFEAGGKVEKTGNYLVGEKGPEIVNLTKGSAVIPNDILKERQNILKKLGPNAPSEKEIANRRNYILSADTEYYKDEPEWLEKDVNSYLESLDKSAFFTPDNLKSITGGAPPKKEEPVATPIDKSQESKSESKVKEKKDGLFSKIFGKKKDKAAPEMDEKDKGPSLLDRGKDLLKNVDKESLIKGGQDLLKNPADLLNNPADLLKSAGGIGMQAMLKKKEDIKPGEIKNTVNKLSKLPEPKRAAKNTTASAPTAEPADKASPVTSQTETNGGEVKTSSASATSTSTSTAASGGSEGMGKDDANEMKSILMRIASLLEGPLSVSSIDAPYRPDSRRV